VLIIAESMTGRVLRVGSGGRVSVLPGRRADDFEVCGGTRSAGVVAVPFVNQVFRDPGPPTAIAGTGRTGFAGDGGPATSARLNGPTCATPAPDGGILVADRGNNRVRRIAPDGTITTIAGNGEAGFSGEGGPATAAGMVPHAIVALPDGGALVTDPRNARVLRIHPDGTLSTFAGTGTPGYDGDGGPARQARLTMPWGIARGADGSVVVADFGSQTVRRISPQGVITTVLGAPPQRVAARSRARTAWVPARRLVSHWVNPQPGETSFGERGTSDESAGGRHAVIRRQGYAGNTTGMTVVRGRTTLDFSPDPPPCWYAGRTRTGLAGDPLQARDLQAGAGAPSPYAPGSGPYAPDLLRGGLILARAPIVLDSTPVFGEPAWWTAWRAQRLVDYLIDRRTGRVVAVQAWSPSGFQRQYRIRRVPDSPPLRAPSTRPRMHYGPRTPNFVSMRCGPEGDTGRTTFGYREGIALARRVNRHLETVPAIRVRVAGRSDVGRRFTATSAFTLERGRTREGITRVVAPGRAQPNVIPPGGSYTALTPRSGGTLFRTQGSTCWIGDVMEDGQEPPALEDLSRVMPLEDAFFEPPRRRGRLIALRAHTAQLTVDSLIDPRSMRLVAQRWIGGGGDRGLVRLTEVRTVPPLPDPAPRCPEDERG
jgi:hypothetical protein